VGNRQSGPGAKDNAYLYNEANQLLEGRTLHYGYDNNGNQTARIVPGATDKTWTQTWDYENRLTKVEKVKGTERRTVTFSYDPFGRRIGKQTETVVDGVTSTKTTSYVYDHEDIVLEITTDGSTTTKTVYTHGPGIDEPLAMERNGSYYYYHADGLGSVTAITDQSKTVVQRYGYDTFGAIMEVADPGFVQPYTYTAREWDRETGLYYYRARYYDPVEGRFIQRDPMGFRGGINLYSYVDNSPILYGDPFGLTKVILLPPGDPNYPAALNRPDIPGVCTVISHGSQRSVAGNNANSLNSLLAKQCQPKEPVVLDACNTGKGDNSIAEQLAKQRGTNVTAPDNIIWTTPWNSELATPYPPLSPDKNSWLNNVPDLRNPGNWNTFKLFTVISYFNYEIAPPYLTTTNNHKATLVLEPKKSRHLFNASAETQRFLKINIKGRLGSGDTVYVLNNYEVIGHVVLP
jgi:RHS repeat-associated protein